MDVHDNCGKNLSLHAMPCSRCKHPVIQNLDYNAYTRAVSCITRASKVTAVSVGDYESVY